MPKAMIALSRSSLPKEALIVSSRTSSASPPISASAARISSASSLLISPVRTVMFSLVGLLDRTAVSKPGVGDRLARLVDVDRLGGGELHHPAAAELDAQVEPVDHDAGQRHQGDHAGDRQPHGRA